MARKPAIKKGLQENTVVIANPLIRSAQALSLAEKRIVFAAAAKMGNNFGEVIIHASEYAETFEMPVKQAYEQLKNAIEGMRTRYFTLAVPDRKGVMKWKINWVQKIGYDDGLARIGLKFTEDVLPYLCDLTKEFTKYKLKQACALRSIHAWRLLELFEQQSSGWLAISVEDFHHAMESTATHRKNFNDLKRKIIAPAMKELQEKDGWLIDFSFTKAGRKVDMLKFTFKKDPQGKLF